MLDLRLLLVLLLLLVSHLLFQVVHLHRVLLLPCARVPLFHPCTVHGIQLFLVVMTRMFVARVPRAGGGSMVGVPVRPKICVLSQRWRQGKFFGRPASHEGRLWCNPLDGNQDQVPGGPVR